MFLKFYIFSNRNLSLEKGSYTIPVLVMKYIMDMLMKCIILSISPTSFSHSNNCFVHLNGLGWDNE